VHPVNRRLAVLVVLVLIPVLALSACGGKSSPIGAEAIRGDLLYYAPEAPEGETVIGIIAHSVSDFEAFLSWSDLPVLVLISSEFTPLDRSATTLLEELAYRYRDEYACLRVDADEYPDVAGFCGLTVVPGFAVIRDGVLVASTGTLSEIDENAVTEILSPS